MKSPLENSSGDSRKWRDSAAPRRALIAAAAALAGAVVLFFELRDGIPRANDLPDHAGTTLQVLNAFRSGVVYPRWMPDFHSGLGEPTLLFYPPGLYFASALLAWICGGDVLWGLFGTLFLFAVVGGLGVFFYLRRFFGTAGGVIACLAFAILPYRFFEIYCAGLYSAFCASCLLPWALHLLARLATPDEPRRRTALLAWAAVYGAIVLINLPTGLFLAYFAFFYFLLETLVGQAGRRIAWILVGGVWGAGLAAVYLVPALAQMRWIQVPAEGLNLYRSNFLFQFAGSWMGPGLRKTFAGMAVFPALAFLISLVCIAEARRRSVLPADERLAAWMRGVVLFGALSLFLAMPVSGWVWSLLPYLKEVNLPWRFLEPMGLTSVAASVAGWAVLRQRRGSKLLQAALAAAFVLLALISLPFDLSIARVNGSVPRREAVAALPNFARKSPLGLFLPKGARPPGELSALPLAACNSPCRVLIRSWSPSGRVIWVVAPQSTTLGVRTYFFPGWVATRADGRRERFPVGAEPGTGRLMVRLPAGETHLLLRFEPTASRRAGAWISLISLAAWGASLAVPRFFRRAG